MGKYKIGDRERVRSDMTEGKSYGLYLNDGMSSYVGIETRISKILEEDTYFLEIDDETYYWHEKMLEPASKFKVGDKVRVKTRTGDKNDYPCAFVDEMTEYSGKEFQIESVEKHIADAGCKYYEEPFKYNLKNIGYVWSSPMLELVAPASKLTSTHVILNRCDAAEGSISTADYATDCAPLIISSSSKKSKSEYVPSYKLETQNNYNLNFNLK